MLKEIENIDSHILWLDSRIIYSDHPTYLLIKLEYVDYYLSESEAKDMGKYWISVYACGPDWPSIPELTSHLDSLGLTLGDWNQFNLEGKLSVLVETGLSARLFHAAGNNKEKLLKQAKEEMNGINTLFGCYMDRPLNAIGSTGWDWIRGDILAGLHKEQTQ